MKRSVPFYTEQAIGVTPTNGNGVASNADSLGSQGHSRGIDSDVVIDDFDPALELKRLRQELIERLLLIQRKAALNAQTEKQKQLAVTIVPTIPQSPQITQPQISLPNQNNKKVNHKPNNPQNPIPTQDIRIESAHNSPDYNQYNPQTFVDPDQSAERIMSNIESARVSIGKLQVPHINLPHLRDAVDKLNEQKNCTYQNEQPEINPQPKIIHQQHIHPAQQTQHEQQINKIPNTDFKQTDSVWITILQKLNVSLSLLGVVGILFSVIYLLRGNSGNFQPGVPVLLVGVVLIVAGLAGHLMQEYVNNRRTLTRSQHTR
ncbi:MAG: hypothetical protein LBQ66_09405 [Planctomycetaceae bacterium]|jgi:hypothetical protein|nr:hypothetical protein [Planctomycetaceae bacterium]